MTRDDGAQVERVRGECRETSRWLAAADWRATVALVLVALAVRVVYLVWVCEWELVEDEAHYWEWARRPGLSYYSKGPGIAWVILAATSALGDAAWAIRLPAAVFSAISALALARLTIDVTSDERAGFIAAAAFCLVPIYQVEAQIMTIDGPFITFWILAAWAAWRAFEAHEEGAFPWGLWALTGLLLGVGFLFKYTIVLLPLAFVVYGVLRRRELPWDRRLKMGALVAAGAMLVAMSPVIVWNARHGWPTVRHTLGHLGAPGGDVPTSWDSPFAGFSTLELMASQIGVVGPPMIVLMVMTVVRELRQQRKRISKALSAANSSRPAEGPEWPHRAYLICCAVVVLCTFFGVSLFSRVEGNWPAPAYVTLLVLVTEMLVSEGDAWRESLRQWRQRARGASPEGSEPRPRPRNSAIRWWHWTTVFGVWTLTVVMYPGLYAELPWMGRAVPMDRIKGATKVAARVEDARALLRRRTGEEPIVIAGSNGVASQLAYYLPGRPVVYDAGRWVGLRGSQYDYWEETDLTDPSLHGRPTVLVVHRAERWREAFELGGVMSLGGQPAISIATDFGGPGP